MEGQANAMDEGGVQMNAAERRLAPKPIKNMQSTLTSIMDNIKKAASHTIECVSEQQDLLTEPQKTEIRNAMQEYVELERELKDNVTMLGEIQSRIAQGEAETFEPKLPIFAEQRLGEMKEGWQSSDIREHDWTLEVNDILGGGGAVNNNDEEDSDDDIAIDSVHETFKCPITAAVINHPVRSKTCPGRCYYEKAAIQSAIKKAQGKVMTCPKAGCTTKIQLSDLVEDKGLERRIARATKQRQKDNTMQQDDDFTEVAE